MIDALPCFVAVIDGLGIAPLGSWSVAQSLAAVQLVALFEPGTHPPGLPQPAIHALRLPGRSHPVKAQFFITYLRDFFGKAPYWERMAAAGLAQDSQACAWVRMSSLCGVNDRTAAGKGG